MDINGEELEWFCLNKVKHIKNYPELNGDVIKSESPDFLIGDVGIECFITSLLTDRNCSILQKESSAINKYVDKYMNNPEQFDINIQNGEARRFIERCCNDRLKGSDQFYPSFISNFKRVYDKHQKHIMDYRAKCKKLGFLIGLCYIKKKPRSDYLIKDDGKLRRLNVRTMPISYEMVECFCHSGVDFVILCIIPDDIPSSQILDSDIQVIKINLDDKSTYESIIKQLRQQQITLCDVFDFNHGIISYNHVSIV